MPRKKKPEPTATADDRLCDLVELAQKLNAPEGFLDDEIHDAAQSEADMIEEDAREEVLHGQLHFLFMHGYELGRLEELIRESVVEDKSA